MRAWRLLAAAVLVTAVTGCGDDPGLTSRPTAKHAVQPLPQRAGIGARSPQAAVRAYVEAIDHRDGRRYCRVMAPWVGTRLDVLGRGAQLRAWGYDCERFIHTYVGYVEDCCPPGFQHARVRSIGKPRIEGELARVPVTIDVQTQTQTDPPATSSLKDVVWLVHRDGDWRVAAPSRVAHAASIAFDPNAGLRRVDPTARPDVHRLEADAARQAREALDAERRRAATFTAVGNGGQCLGGVAVADEATDLQATRPPKRLPAGADLREARIAVEDDDVCFSVTFARVPRDPAWLSLRLAASGAPDGGGVTRSVEVELPGDGTARITSGEDATGDGVPAPGTVSREGARFTVTVGRRVFEEPLPGTRSAVAPGALNLRRFVFGIGTVARVDGRLMKDGLGESEEPSDRAYPSGERCRSSCP